MKVNHTERNPKILVALMVVLGVVCFAPGTASAAFTRPFLHPITETTPGAPLAPLGLAVDKEDSLWVSGSVGVGVGKVPHPLLDQFSSAELGNSFLKALEPKTPENNVTNPESLAIDRSTGSFSGSFYYIGNSFYDKTSELTIGGGYLEIFDKTGAFVKQLGPFESPTGVAVDNSTGSVYVIHGLDRQPPAGDGKPPGIEKLNASGEPKDFEGCAECSSYVTGNQITGAPGVSFEGGHNEPRAIATDSHGDIYVAVAEYQQRNERAVLEYEPSGHFVRAFTGQETPGLNGSHEEGGFGGNLAGVAVDPVNGDVLISLAGGGDTGAIDEFDSSGHFLHQILETSPGRLLHGPLEMTVDSNGNLYVVESILAQDGKSKSAVAVDVYGSGHLLPDLRLGEATQRTQTTVVLTGSVDPLALTLSDCHFEYVTEAAFNLTGFSNLASGGERPCLPGTAGIPQDKSFHPVHADISGLTSAVTYRYRLLATTATALGGPAISEPLAFTAPAPPRIDSTTAGNLSSTFADLSARIDPLGADTTYQFQYVDAAHYQPAGEDPYAAGSSVPVPPGDIGSGGATGSSPEPVLQHIGGLAPSTEYHFRVIATNELGVTTAADATFTTLPVVSPGLPDGRAYELLTPPNKGGAEDMFADPIQNDEFKNKGDGYSSESGDGFLLTTYAAFGSFPASFNNAYVFSRTPGGWATTSLASPSLGTQSLGAAVVDPFDFSRVGLADRSGSYAGPGGSQPLSAVGAPGGPYTILHADPPEHKLEIEPTHIVGGSRDLSRVVLESTNHALAPGAGLLDEGSRALYESAGGGECGLESSNCTLLNVNTAGTLLNRCGAILGQATNSGTRRNAVSADGSRVFFTAPDPFMSPTNQGPGGPGCWNGATSNAPQLYMRSGGATVEVSKPETGFVDPSGRHAAIYAGASSDGSRVFFLTKSELTKDDEGIHDLELYEYDTETGKLTRVSSGASGKAAASVFTVPAISADGSAVYFMAYGALAPGAPALAEPAQKTGADVNVYRYDTASRSTTYIATVSEYDYPNDFASGQWWKNFVSQPQFALDTGANWNTTPDGRFLLFASIRGLAGNSTAAAPVNHCHQSAPDRQGEKTEGHCAELYRYDAVAAEKHETSLVCVSCNPSGAPPTSHARFDRSAAEGPAAAPPRAISDDGSYVFFDTADALVPQDTNGTLDVYEWHNGAISLISSGQDSAPSFFLGSSPDGHNVFFGTHARLVPQDTDTAGDVYDARICAAADPCIQPPAGETAQCEGDACQSVPPAPIDATPPH